MKTFPAVSIPQRWQHAVGQFWGALRSETLMQLRRWSVGVIFGGVACVQGLLLWIGIISNPFLWRNSFAEIVRVQVYGQMISLNWLLPLVVGLLVADRLPRTRTLHIDEVYTSMLPRTGWYILGKYWANVLVIGIYTWLVVMLDGVVQVLAGVPLPFLSSLSLAFWVILVPVLLLVISFVFLLSCFYSTRITQLLFPVIWLYCTLAGLVFTPANTIFAPDGHYALEGLWGINQVLHLPTYSHTEIAVNIVLVLCMAALCLLLTNRLVFALARNQRTSKQVSIQQVKQSRSAKKLTRWQWIERRITLWSYHLRVTQPFLLLSLLVGLLLISLLIVKNVGVSSLSHAFACDALELGIPLLAGVLASSAVMGDRTRELFICTEQGIKRIFWTRMGIFLLALACAATLFLVFSKFLHVQYTAHDTPLLLLSLWLVPLFLAAMVGLLGALLTRSSALGGAIACIFVLQPHIAYFITLRFPILRFFFLPLALYYPQTDIWWANRLVLLTLGVVCLLLSLWLMRKDERLVEAHI